MTVLLSYFISIQSIPTLFSILTQKLYNPKKSCGNNDGRFSSQDWAEHFFISATDETNLRLRMLCSQDATATRLLLSDSNNKNIYTNTVKWNRRLVCLWSKMSTFQTGFLPPKNVGIPTASLGFQTTIESFQMRYVWCFITRGIKTARGQS